jgi:hypothetical protein
VTTWSRSRAWSVGLAVILLAGAMAVPGPAAGATAVADPEAPTAPAVVDGASEPTLSVAAAPADSGEWGPVLDWGVQAKHMAMLSTGKVLVFSTGLNARVWDPATGTFQLAPATFGDLHCAGQSTLADGRVIVIGGQEGSAHDGIKVTAIFDPVTQTWTRGSDMTDPRWYGTSTTLADGRVLATAGDGPNGFRSIIPEIYDPTTDTWTQLTGAVRDQVLYPFMFVLPDGRPYHAGSKTTTAYLDLSGTGSWTPGPTAPYQTNGYSESAVMYRPGKILRAGGGDPAHARSVVIDMTAASPTWREIAPMSFARRRMNLTILADGSVMAIGGTGQSDNEAAAVLAGEIWDPVTESWSTVSAMSEARMYHSSAVMLADGRVVVGGGEAAGRLRAQVYSPPYLFNGPRPTISSSPATADYGGTFQVTTPNAADIVSVALLRPSAATHALDMNQRYAPLAYTRSGNVLTATAPASGGVAPPGDYMLLIKNTAGVPSVASWIRIGTSGSLEPGTITGRVTDSSTDAAIAGVTVATATDSTTTDAQGRYTLEDVTPGEVQVTYQAVGYATETRQVQVGGGDTVTQDVAMGAPGSVTGRVTDAAAGNAIAGVTVAHAGGVATTDSQGRYTISGLPAGQHLLTFSAPGFVTGEGTATVQAGQVTTFDLALARPPTYVSGEVRDVATNAELQGATVSVDTGQSTTTDVQGRYRIDLPPGTYTVSVTKAGYIGATATAVINGGSYATVDFNLTTAAAPPPGAGIAFRSASSAANTTATTLVIPAPAGVVAGDALLASVAARGAPVLTPPAGWTLVRLDLSGGTIRQAVYVKIAGASEPASYSFGLSSAQSAAGGIVAYSGVDPTTPIDAHGGQINTSSVTSTAPSITTTGVNRMLVGLFAKSTLTTHTPPAGMTERFDQQVPAANQYKVTVSATDQPLAAAGATGTRVATTAQAGHSVGQLVALRPASGG